MGIPVVEVPSGGIAATNTPKGAPVIAGTRGFPVTWVASGGLPLNKIGEILPIFPSGGMLSEARGNLNDQSMITGTTGTVTARDGGLTLGASSAVTYGNSGPWTGNLWAITVVDMVVSQSGSYRPRFLNATYNPEALRNREGHMSWKFPAPASALDLQFQTGAGFAGDLLAMQIYDMTSILAQPADVYIAAGQSNMASTTNGLGVDMLKDVWPDRRCLYFPGSTQAAYGAVQGQPMAMVPPLQSNGTATGLSPAYSFAREIVKRTPANRNVVVIQAAQGGTGLLGADAPWNPSGSSPTAYNAAVSLVTAAMAALPAGSTIKGVLWAQGESDSALDLSTYPAAFASMRSSFQTAIGSGVVPWMLILPPADASRANQAALIDMQTKMDEDSGHSYAQTKVHCVARPTGYMEDDTHVNAAGQRLAGKAIADRYVAEGYI